jgi:hypothetical protein
MADSVDPVIANRRGIVPRPQQPAIARADLGRFVRIGDVPGWLCGALVIGFQALCYTGC